MQSGSDFGDKEYGDGYKRQRVRYAFQSAGRVACYQEILKGLNAMEQEEDTGLVWENNRLTTLLRHEAYIGDVLTNKSYCPARHVQVANRGERDQYCLLYTSWANRGRQNIGHVCAVFRYAGRPCSHRPSHGIQRDKHSQGYAL